jgi:hypothetical protein
MDLLACVEIAVVSQTNLWKCDVNCYCFASYSEIVVSWICWDCNEFSVVLAVVVTSDIQ